MSGGQGTEKAARPEGKAAVAEAEGRAARLRSLVDYATGGHSTEFGKMMGWTSQYTNGLLNGKPANIGLSPLATILRRMPEIDARWLLLGEGDMLRTVADAAGRGATLLARAAGRASRGLYGRQAAASIIREIERFADRLEAVLEALPEGVE